MQNVSVIVPVYNKELSLARTIESVLNQTFKNFELILINDGSTDKSKNVIKKYQEQDSRIVYIEQENRGVSIARNLGIDKSNFEYISFLDAGDVIECDFLEKMTSKIDKSNVCFCGHYNVIDDIKIKARFKYYEGDVLDKYLYNICTPNTNSWLIKRSYLNENNIRFSPNINWGEDMEFFGKVLFNDKNVKCVDESLSYYFRDKSNTLSENNLDKINKDIYWLERFKNYISDNENDEKRKVKLIECIDTYRLPANIIYRMKMNLGVVEDKEIINIRSSFKQYIDKIKLTNGLRSLKLIYHKNRLRVLLELPKIKPKRNY